MKLDKYDDIIGTLEDITEEKDHISLTFSFKKTIEIPKDALPIEKLNKCKNKRIGILNTGEKYLISKIAGKIKF